MTASHNVTEASVIRARIIMTASMVPAAALDLSWKALASEPLNSGLRA